jgi:hypothetical protein
MARASLEKFENGLSASITLRVSIEGNFVGIVTARESTPCKVE